MTGRQDRGAATVELVIITPVLISFLFLVILTGRLTDARSDVVAAATDAARVASLQEDGDAARSQAQLAAEDTVSGERLNCQGGPQVSTSFEPGGAFVRGANVHVTVTCIVDVRDLTYIGLPGINVTLTEHAWEPIDTHRSL